MFFWILLFCIFFLIVLIRFRDLLFCIKVSFFGFLEVFRVCVFRFFLRYCDLWILGIFCWEDYKLGVVDLICGFFYFLFYNLYMFYGIKKRRNLLVLLYNSFNDSFRGSVKRVIERKLRLIELGGFEGVMWFIFLFLNISVNFKDWFIVFF